MAKIVMVYNRVNVSSTKKIITNPIMHIEIVKVIADKKNRFSRERFSLSKKM